jgi:hypothetical protein
MFSPKSTLMTAFTSPSNAMIVLAGTRDYELHHNRTDNSGIHARSCCQFVHVTLDVVLNRTGPVGARA